MKLTVDVLKQDIRVGRKSNGQDCAIARALKRALKGNEEGVTLGGVGSSSINLKTADGQSFSVPTPRAAGRFVRGFDSKPKSQSKPLSFTLRFTVPAPLENATA